MDDQKDIDQWTSSIGRAILAFGQIEQAAASAISATCTGPILDTLLNLGLERKLGLIDKILSEYSSGEIDIVRAAFREAYGLVPTRNLIAHSPLVLDFFVSDDNHISMQGRIRSVRKKDIHISLPQIKEFATKVEEVAMLLTRAVIIKSPRALLNSAKT